MKIKVVTVLFCSVFIVSAQQADKDSLPTSSDVFLQLAEQWRLAYNSKDAKNFVLLYAENAQYISGHVLDMKRTAATR